jgi:hypothetical protein
MKCCICGNEIQPQRHPDTGQIVWDQGHNAEPVVENGRCCDECNWTVVIAARLVNAGV